MSSSEALNEGSFESYLELLRIRAEEQPDALAYTFQSEGEEVERQTFAEMDRRARAIAAQLQQHVPPGERALLLYPAGLSYIAAFFGCLYAGVVAVPAYPPRMNRNLSRLLAILEDARPVVALTDEGIHSQVSKRFEDTPQLTSIRWLSTEGLEGGLAEEWSAPPISRDSLAFLQYTSGSTARPKGVMVSHGNLLQNQALMAKALGHDQDTVIVSWLPLYHDMGLIGNILCSVYNGGSCHLMAPVDFLKKPVRWLQAITRYRATFSGAPDFGYALCAEKITAEEKESLDLRSWKAAFNGSEPVRAATLSQFSEAFSSCGFREEALFPCYGLAEYTLFAAGQFQTQPPLAFSRLGLERHRARRARESADADLLISCGTMPLDGRVVIVDPETRERVAPDQVGEIWLGGQSAAQGYWNQEDLTREVFQARVAGNGDGPFLRTGDLGFLHEGNLYITGRLKDLIILRGKNLYPQDVELSVEDSHPALRRGFAAAFAVEEAGLERLVVMAEVEREKRHDLEVEEVITAARQAVGRDHAVEVSAFLLLRPGQLPKTSSGKTQRQAAKKGYLERTLDCIAEWHRSLPATGSASDRRQPVSAAHDSVRAEEGFLDWLVERLAEKLEVPLESVDPDRALASFGLDSVAAVELIADIEASFGVSMEVEALFDGEPSLRMVAQALTAQEPEVAGVAQASAPPSSGAPGPAPQEERAAESRTAPQAAAAAPRRRKDYDGLQEEGEKGGNGWHPFRTHVNPEVGRLLTQMKMDKVFVRGEGCYLYDAEGERFLDFLAQYGALPFGFNPPHVWEALALVRDRKEPSLVQPSALEAAGELARRLIEVAPAGLRYVTFANSGAETVEAAIKLCRSATGRKNILAANKGFHGKTLGALSATDKKKYQEPFGAPFPGFGYVPYGDLGALKEALSSREFAAFLVEPIQGEGGIIEPPMGYLRRVREICTETGTMMVADEVQTGLGRTGALFACEAEGITPDVMTLAKALGGGLIPIGAILATPGAYNEDFALHHTSTFAGNSLACRAGLATLDLLLENDRALIRQVADNGARLKASLLDLQRRYPHIIGLVRGRGYMLGLRFGLDRHSGSPGLLGYLGEDELLTALVVSHLLHFEKVRVGYTLNEGGVLRIQPPLVATWEECELFVAALTRVVERLDEGNIALLTAHVSGFDPPTAEMLAVRSGGARRDQSVHISTAARRGPQKDDGRFAFLVHPLASRDYGDLDTSLGVLSDEQIKRLSAAIADNFDPFVVGETALLSNAGRTAYGEFILIPRSTEELVSMPYEEAVEEVQAAVKLAQDRGARIVGLGAFLSVISRGGLSLRGKGLPALTTGNTYTVAAGHQALRLGAAQRGLSLAECQVGVLGATGAIGKALSKLLAQDVGQLVLLGNPANREQAFKRMQELAGEIVERFWHLNQQGESLPATPLVRSGLQVARGKVGADPLDRQARQALGEELLALTDALHISCDAPEWLPSCQIVATATSSVEALVRPELLQKEAVVCDISRPSNVSPDLVIQHPGVLLIDGGVVSMPEGCRLGLSTSLDVGQAYACMAETMMLALEGHYEDTSLGFDLNLDQVRWLERLAERHGFRPVMPDPKPVALNVSV